MFLSDKVRGKNPQREEIYFLLSYILVRYFFLLMRLYSPTRLALLIKSVIMKKSTSLFGSYFS